jgi:RimJ/RimL family protein N-acetyltransferase
VTLQLRHVERLSSDPEVMHFARRINTQFLRSGLTELRKLDSECEAVYLHDGKGRIASVVVFYRLEDSDSIEYYLPVVWTNPKYRGEGCYERLLQWLKDYASGKGARRISADVHHYNNRMMHLMEKHWDKTFVRFNLAI